LQPNFKLALIRPDFAHLRPGITVDHAGNIKATAVSEKRFRLQQRGIQLCRALFSAHLREKAGPLRTADTTALRA